MSELEFHPLTADRWDDLVALFEHHGNPGYCWCMIWRIARPARTGNWIPASAGRRCRPWSIRARPTGILAYLDGEPVGWCSVAPRETYQRLERSKTLKRIDDLATWSVVCFYLNRKLRHRGLPVKLLTAAVDYAVSQGGGGGRRLPGRASQRRTRDLAAHCQLPLHGLSLHLRESRLSAGSGCLPGPAHHALPRLCARAGFIRRRCVARRFSFSPGRAAFAVWEADPAGPASQTGQETPSVRQPFHLRTGRRRTRRS